MVAVDFASDVHLEECAAGRGWIGAFLPGFLWAWRENAGAGDGATETPS